MINNPTTVRGTSGQVLVNGTIGKALAGQLTLTLPQSLSTTSAPVFTELTLSNLSTNSFLYAGASGLLRSTTAATNGQLLIGSTGSVPAKSTLTAGDGIGITNGAGTITISSTGVASIIAGSGISVSGATGDVTISSASGTVLQTVYGAVTSSSSNSQIPYDNTTPTITEGAQIWSREFTPISATSLILITTSSFYAIASSSNIFASAAYFSDTTNIFAQSLGFSTDNGETNSFTVVGSHIAGSTTARTYTCRMGPNGNVTMYIAQGTGGQAYGNSSNSGRYIIQEIAI